MSKITIDLTKTVKEIITTMKKAIDSLQDQLTFDTTPTAGSSNPVTSGGIKTVLDTKLDKTGEGASGTWGINITGNANTATKATQDASGNVITTTYAKKSEIPSVPVKGVKISGSTSNLTPDTSGIVTIPAIPTKVSAFTNDAGYLTAHQSLSNYYTKTQVDSAISNAIASITDGDSNSY